LSELPPLQVETAVEAVPDEEGPLPETADSL
jgi:hypothetical protein